MLGSHPDSTSAWFSDVEESLKEDVKTIRENPFLPKNVEVTGWVYDVKTGRLREVAVT